MNILASVADKEGLSEFLTRIKEHITVIYATGRTNQYLQEKGFNTLSTSVITGLDELLGGRVKTLHPGIFAGILSRRSEEDDLELADRNYPNFDMVISNLYPFRSVSSGSDVHAMIENIDIGGVSLVRAAAKNYTHVVILSDPSDYSPVADEMADSGKVTRETREKLALKAFSRMTDYDSMIFRSLSRVLDPESNGNISLNMEFVTKLRYGENPMQKAELYSDLTGTGIAGAFKMSGKDLSYNNYLDADAAYSAVMEFEDPASVVVKHLTPCGVSVSDKLSEAYVKAHRADLESAYGSVVAFNRPVDEETAEKMLKHFVEVIVAPGYEGESFNMLRKKKKEPRILRVKPVNSPEGEYRSISGGLLRQDLINTSLSGLKLQTSKEASQDLVRDMEFAWKVSAYCKSNSIVIAKNRTTVGIGGGQPSRVRAMKIALDLAGEKSQGAVVASDGFFPFSDSVELAAANGIAAIIEPGGSIRDNEVIAEAEKSGIPLYFTGTRVFRH